MATTDPTGDFLLVIDMQGHERYLNPANIASVQFVANASGDEPRAVILMTAPVAPSGQHQFQIAGEQAVALRAELRRRMQLPDEDAPAPPALTLTQPPRQEFGYQR